MKRFYLDTEFNEHGGELISIALVADDGEEFYAEVELLESWKPWVHEHVKPKLTGPVLRPQLLQAYLHLFLQPHDNCEIICDWPADIAHLCKLLDKGNGERYGPRNMTFRLVGGVDSYPENPHHALSDARALRQALMEPKEMVS